jgi:hypothetical protein
MAENAARRISSSVTASAKPSAAVTKTRCDPSRTRATLAARQTINSTPAASAAAASSAVSAVTCAACLPALLSARRPATVWLRSTSRPPKSKMRGINPS